MRSRPVFFLVLSTIGLTAALPARDANASYASRHPGLGGAGASMQVFGSYSPGLGDDSRMGYGIALRWKLSDRLALGLDASRLSNDYGSIAPFGAGLVLGPRSSGDLRPWVELGAAYVRVSKSFSGPIYALSSAGNPRDSFDSATRILPYATRSATDAWGPYFGAGLTWSASDHVGLFGGVRAYNWKESTFATAPWDGAVAIRTGLSFGF